MRTRSGKSCANFKSSHIRQTPQDPGLGLRMRKNAGPEPRTRGNKPDQPSLTQPD